MTNPNETNEAILNRIRALLNKAERTDNEHERDAYNAKAAELLAKYGIDRAMLPPDDPQADVVGDRVVRVPSPFSRDKATLIGSIAMALGCQALLRRARDRNGWEIHLFGFTSDLDRSEILYTSLLLQSATALSRLTVPWNQDPGAYKRSFLEGFRRVVTLRLREAEAAAKARREDERRAAGGAGPSTDLVLAQRKDRVEKVFREAYPRTRTTTRNLSGSGYGAGKQAGREANLSTSSGLGRSRQQALGR